MKRFSYCFIIVLLLFLVWGNICYGEEGIICFKESDARDVLEKIKVELVVEEQLRFTQELLVNCNNEKDILLDMKKDLELKNEACENTVIEYKKMTEIQKKIIEGSKEQLWKGVLNSIGFVGLGVLIGLLL